MASTFLEYSYTIITILLVVIFLKKSLIRVGNIKTEIKRWALFGFLFNLYSLSWLYTTYPLPWITEGVTQLIGITLLHIISSVVAGIGFFIVGFSFDEKLETSYKPIIFGLLLSLAEILRSIFLSTLFAGNGGIIGLHWSAGTIGNALSTTPFIEYAYFGGTYALTFVLGLFVYICISKKHLKLYWKYLLAICVVLILTHFFIPTSGPERKVDVGVITTNFKTPKDGGDVDTYRLQSKTVQKMTLNLTNPSPEIIVYPEDTRYLEYITEIGKKDLNKYFNGSVFIDGDTVSLTNGFSNYSIFYEPNTEKMFGRGKYFLFPFNEYVPSIFEYLFRIFVSGDDLNKYIQNHTYTPQKFTGAHHFKDLRIGTLICSEILSFQTVNSLRKTKPNLVVYQSHLAVFHNSPWFIAEQRSFNKVAAAQLRTPLIGVSDGAPSFIISPYGKIISTINTGFSVNKYSIYKDKIIIEK